MATERLLADIETRSPLARSIVEGGVAVANVKTYADEALTRSSVDAYKGYQGYKEIPKHRQGSFCKKFIDNILQPLLLILKIFDNFINCPRLLVCILMPANFQEFCRTTSNTICHSNYSFHTRFSSGLEFDRSSLFEISVRLTT